MELKILAGEQKFPVIVCFDLETTGLDYETDKIIEVGIFKFTLDKTGEIIKLGEYSALVDPEIELPQASELITGIKREELVGQPVIGEILPEISKKFEGADFILGHNIGFDLSFLEKYLPLKFKSLDSQFFAQTFFPGLPSYSLDVLPFELHIARNAGHRALPDAINSAEVFAKSLKQFAALKIKSQVLELAKKGGLVEAEILERASDFLASEKPFKPAEKLKSQSAIAPEIKKAASEKFKNKKQNLIFHSACAGAAASAMDGINFKRGKIIVAVKNLDELKDGIVPMKNFSRLICRTRLAGLLNKKSLQRHEATMAMKLSVSDEAKLSREERNFLPSVLVFQETCQSHACENYKKLEILKQKNFAIGLTHFDFWSLAAIPSGSKLLLTDFDEAVDSLIKKLEIKLSADFLPQILSGITTDDDETKKLISQVIDKNDLFWGMLNINFKKAGEPYALLTPELRDDYELRKSFIAANNLTACLAKLISILQNSDDEYAKSFGFYLNRALASWQALEREEDYHIYVEKNFEGLGLKLASSFKLIESEFKKRIPATALLTAATGADGISMHYINTLGLQHWPVAKIDLPSLKRCSLFVATSNTPMVEKALKIILTEAPTKSVIVAKNLREAAVFQEHLQKNLPLPVISADNGAKALYNFAREERAVLIVSPRGRVWDLPWPQIDLAVVSSIPFPLPEAHFSFISGTLPKAMLAQKSLIAKILKSSGPDLRIYLTDPRLTGQTYGENFIVLTSQLTGAKPEFLRI